jgi:hypothetical protein
MSIVERIEVRDQIDGLTTFTITDPDAIRLVASAVTAGEPKSGDERSFGVGDPVLVAFVGPKGLAEVVNADLKQRRTADGRELPPEVVEILNPTA